MPAHTLRILIPSACRNSIHAPKKHKVAVATFSVGLMYISKISSGIYVANQKLSAANPVNTAPKIISPRKSYHQLRRCFFINVVSILCFIFRSAKVQHFLQLCKFCDIFLKSFTFYLDTWEKSSNFAAQKEYTINFNLL